MKISVIIVNYNVRHFLEQCVASVRRALHSLQGEILVFDNASVDDSVLMLRQHFPDVHCIESKTNLGFSKANNAAAKLAKGEYVLILNPDTVLPEDCLIRCLEFLDAHPDAGALGVKMVDGQGKFLPESKRGFPGFWVSFCKMIGLYKLFPASSIFNGYYMGHLKENETNEVDVLTGAFMMMRKELWEKVDGLDEDYFMYGEDIDLSYRIQKAGYKNYYFPSTTIIHYKGESTSKGSLNYVVTFYNAMIIFAKKHFAGSNKFALIGFLSGIVWLKAFVASVQSTVSKIKIVGLDMLALMVGFYLIKYYWALWYHGNANYFNSQTIYVNLGLFVLIWASCFYYQGVYEKKFSLKDLLIAAISGFIINLLFYALFPEHWRASRMLLILSFLWVVLYALLSRLLLNRWFLKSWIIGSDYKKNILVIGDIIQIQKVNSLLSSNRQSFDLLTKDPNELDFYDREQWTDFIRINQIKEIILCQKNLNWTQILNLMTDLKDEVNYKIMTESGSGIIGSSSKNDRGEIFSLDLDYNLSQRVYLRQKRLFDVFFTMILFVFFWLFIFLFESKKQFLLNLYYVLIGKLTWVSYQTKDSIKARLPIIKQGVIFPVQHIEHILTKEFESQLLTMYAWNYSIWTDLDICLRDFQKLDQLPYGSNH
ncbi:MAG: glycosyltransferase [Saprospiraceae bacterium]|nr:glycosyltransferase [Saprospiraceae bacterium]MBK9221996.1 glycosyltransferase [Saprospiraceae bacterium]